MIIITIFDKFFYFKGVWYDLYVLGFMCIIC